MNHIEGKDLSLDEYLGLLFSKDCSKLFPNNCFPTEEMGDIFLSRIDEFDENFIKNLLRKFLVKNCSYGIDEHYAQWLLEDIRNKRRNLKEVLSTERGRKLLIKSKNKDYDVWEGVTWILDLLPNQPKIALEGLNAYFTANFWSLPDYAISGLLDSLAIIRAKYINYNHKKEVFRDITPLDFEKLIYKLYDSLGYKVEMTKRSYDGGIDIIANKVDVSQKEYLLIQCKRPDVRNAKVNEVRELFAVIHDRKSTKGVLVCSTDFTTEAKKFADNNKSVELINSEQLIVLLNENFGIHWIYRINDLIKISN